MTSHVYITINLFNLCQQSFLPFYICFFKCWHRLNEPIKDTVAYLNPIQTPVIAVDQPIYTLAKQIQWHWPEKYGEDKFVIMFGGLHIEMAALKSIGTLLQKSGWTEAIVGAGIASWGTAESFLSASSVTRTRQMHQATVSTL